MNNTHHHDLPHLKDRLLIPEVWQALRLEGQPAARCRSPFRPDKTPSFSIYEGGRKWKDFGTGEKGDVIDFIATARQITTAQALRQFLEMAGVPQTTLPAPRRKKPQPATPSHRVQQAVAPAGISKTQPQPPAASAASTAAATPAAPGGKVCVPLRRGTEAERQQVADTRHLVLEAVHLAMGLRTLTFGTVRGFQCWILTDPDLRCAEARRLDGHPFPECGPLVARKAHTLRGSSKSWPLGVAVLRTVPQFRTLLIVEGGPDYLAALHFAHEQERWDVLPVAVLGRSTGGRMDKEALELMRGRRVRIYPHNDADGGGTKSAQAWAMQLQQVGCWVDLFDFAKLRRTDGTPIKDLNDCTTGLDPASATSLRHNLFPRPEREVEPPF